MIGKRVGGTITFGGGLGLYADRKKAIGGLGLSGDTACADDAIARRVREALRLVPTVADTITSGRVGISTHPANSRQLGAASVPR